MRLLAGTIFAGLALIAGSVVFYTLESPNDQWVGAEEIARAQIEALGRRPDWVRQVSGPVLRVLIASPGDTPIERKVVRAALMVGSCQWEKTSRNVLPIDQTECAHGAEPGLQWP